MLNLDPYGGTDQLGTFPLFVKRTADVMALDHSTILSDRSQHVMVDGCQSKLDDVVSGVPQGSVFVRPVHFGAFFHSGK